MFFFCYVFMLFSCQSGGPALMFDVATLERSKNQLIHVCIYKKENEKKKSLKTIHFDMIRLNIYASMFRAIKRVCENCVKNIKRISTFDRKQSENHEFIFLLFVIKL